jgi:hypothetical protein
MARKYIANGRLRYRDGWLEPGDEFVVEPYMKIRAWIERGLIRVVESDDAPASPPPADEPVAETSSDDLTELKKAELVAMLGESGHSLEDVEGTGSGGSVTKQDLVDFLKD